MSDLRQEWNNYLYQLKYGEFSIEAFVGWFFATPGMEMLLDRTIYEDLLHFDYWAPNALHELEIKLTPVALPEWREQVRYLLCSLQNPATDHFMVCSELANLQDQHNIGWIPMTFYVIAVQFSEYPHPSTHQYWNPDSLAKEMNGYEGFVSSSRLEAQQAAEKVLAEQFPEDPCG